jgi:hypothetical protein
VYTAGAVKIVGFFWVGGIFLCYGEKERGRKEGTVVIYERRKKVQVQGQ